MEHFILFILVLLIYLILFMQNLISFRIERLMNNERCVIEKKRKTATFSRKIEKKRRSSV